VLAFTSLKLHGCVPAKFRLSRKHTYLTRQAMTCNLTIWRLRVTTVAGKCNNITYSQCVSVVLVIQQVMHMCLTVLSSVACLSLPYFSSSSHKGHHYRKKKLLDINECVIIFSTTCVWNIPHSKKNWARYLYIKYPLFLSDINKIWIFKKYSNIRFHENPFIGNRVVPRARTDGLTDGQTGRQTCMMKLIAAFSKFFEHA
jgi:hypothetical protein